MLMRALLALLVAASIVSAQESPNERFYQAIRGDDLTALRELVRQFGVDARDSTGQTPLMLAVAFGSTEAVRLLLEAGADPRATTSAGVTALHWLRGDAERTRLLLERGADANARSQIGRTPLMIAAASIGSSEAVRALLAKGADVNAADNTGATALTEAVSADQTGIAKLLIERGALVEPKAPATPGVVALLGTPLSVAAMKGNVELVQLLLSRGANVHHTSIGNATVKNGPIAFGRTTPLHMAAVGGHVGTARMLLEAGAAVNARDVRGFTPLAFAVATDRSRPELIQLLIERGADPKLPSEGGETSIDWARKYNDPAVLAVLKLPPAAEPVARPTAAASAEGAPRQAIERSLAILRPTSSRMQAAGGCVACHAQPITTSAIEVARANGVALAPAPQESTEMRATVSALAPMALQVVSLPGLPDGSLYSSMTLAALQMPANVGTDSLVYNLAATQQPDGSWGGTAGQARPPMQDGGFSRAALAIRTLKAYATPARKRELDERIARAARWLAREQPLTTEDRVMQLLGLRWAGAHDDVIDRRLKELVTLQRSDGGWAQTPHLRSDAYATGEVLYALRELDVPASVSTIQRGAAFLLRTQEDDGSWKVKSRAMKIQPYFESGFPHGHDQWISQAGTAWAAMALSRTSVAPPTPARSAR
jgi:ankyrin repeat protein